MSKAKWYLQHLAIEMMMNVYQILLANTSPNYLCILSYSNKTLSDVLRGFTGGHVEESVKVIEKQ